MAVRLNHCLLFTREAFLELVEVLHSLDLSLYRCLNSTTFRLTVTS